MAIHIQFVAELSFFSLLNIVSLLAFVSHLQWNLWYQDPCKPIQFILKVKVIKIWRRWFLKFFSLSIFPSPFSYYIFSQLFAYIMWESRCPKVSLCKGFAFYRLLYFLRKSTCLLTKLNWYLSLQTIHLQLTMSHNGGCSQFNI